MSFITAVNCMDGRVQEPVIAYLKEKFSRKYVDMITEPSPVKILAEAPNGTQAESILNRLDISVNVHKSNIIAVIGHPDCAGNPTDDDRHKRQVISARDFIKEKYPDAKVIGLWLGGKFTSDDISLC